MTRVRLSFCLLLNRASPFTVESMLGCHSGRNAEQYESSNGKLLHCVRFSSLTENKKKSLSGDFMSTIWIAHNN